MMKPNNGGMEDNMKKIIVTVLCAVMTCTMFTQSVNAADDSVNEVISFDTYSEVMTNKYLEYGYEVEFEEPDENLVITKKILMEDLEKADKYLKEKKILEAEKQEISINNEGEMGTAEIEPYALMLYTKEMTKSELVSDLSLPIVPRTCLINVTVTLQLDAQYNQIRKLTKDPALNIKSATGYADYVVLKSYNTVVNNSNSDYKKRYIVVNITCELKQESSIGVVGSWVKVDESLSLKFYPFK